MSTSTEARECTLSDRPVRQRTVGRDRKTCRRHRARNVIALEVDLTTPLAYMWSRTDLDRYRWSGLLRPEHALERANLLLIRPYEPNKIPVVMVHGLISTPLAWIPMLNELLRDPVIQDHYQFLLYMYPTGVPIPIAAASLRESLAPGEATLQSGRPRPGLRPDGPPGPQHGGPAWPAPWRFRAATSSGGSIPIADSTTSWARAKSSTSCASISSSSRFRSSAALSSWPLRIAARTTLEASSAGSAPT